MKEIKASDFQSEVLEGNKVVLDFYSTQCPPCEALAPKFDSLAELYGDDVKFLKIFRQENRELSEQLSVKSSPTLLFFQDGKETGNRLSGGIKRSDIMQELDAMIAPEKAEKIHRSIKPFTSEFDVAVLGGGPGGLTAGLYLCQAKINTVLIDTSLPGGQVSTTHSVSNYPGFIDPQPGYMLSHNMSEQTKRCGTEYKVAVDVTKVDLKRKEIVIDDQETIKAKKIIIATGSSPNLLNVPGERELKGQGISYCATCDAKYFVDKEVVVIGGGNSAIEEAEFISKFASKITVVHQFDHLQANKAAQEKAFANDKIDFVFEHEPQSFRREGDKVMVDIEGVNTKQKKTITADGVFIFIGMRPNMKLFNDQGLLVDEWGYIETNEDKQTNIKDIYAVGDIVSKKYRQITTAIADGTVAAIAVTREIGE